MENQEKLLAIIKRHLPLGSDTNTLDMSTNLLKMGLDSMATIDLMMDIEQGFEIELPDEALTASAFETAQDISAYIPVFMDSSV